MADKFEVSATSFYLTSKGCGGNVFVQPPVPQDSHDAVKSNLEKLAGVGMVHMHSHPARTFIEIAGVHTGCRELEQDGHNITLARACGNMVVDAMRQAKLDASLK